MYTIPAARYLGSTDLQVSGSQLAGFFCASREEGHVSINCSSTLILRKGKKGTSCRKQLLNLSFPRITNPKNPHLARFSKPFHSLPCRSNQNILHNQISIFVLRAKRERIFLYPRVWLVYLSLNQHTSLFTPCIQRNLISSHHSTPLTK
jgi:hypothetical protein